MYISTGREEHPSREHRADLCVVGGGMAGMLAAIAAARHGADVVLMQDRPVLGGNASGEIRMWIRGAHGENQQETGILEEIALDNIHRNPSLNFSVWDSVLYEKVRFEPRITLLLNCSCCGLSMEGDRIAEIRGWQTTSQTWHTVRAKTYADCSGDSVLAPLSGALWRIGREGSDEFGEDIEPAASDRKTMGMSCLLQARETPSKKNFIPPVWANRYTKEDFLFRLNFNTPTSWTTNNFWWMELGGEADSIHDTEELRDELLKVAFGVWDFIKNSGEVSAGNWELDWLGFLPGKRESRRYVGDHILTQNDVRGGGRFNDLVAYGGWSMDDHHPGGFRYAGEPTVFHPAPSPYGIPYRCLYSKNIDNLFFAGRNISATHAALSSTRVMATCAVMGQAVGTAAAIAARDGLSPRGVYKQRIGELKQTLMEDDCYLPYHSREIPALTRQAKLTASHGDPADLVNGFDRPSGDSYNGWIAPEGAWAELDFGRGVQISEVRLVFDSDLNRETWQEINHYFKRYPMRCNINAGENPVFTPGTLVRAFRIEVQNGGSWKTVFIEEDNHQRLVRIPLQAAAEKVRLICEKSHGCGQTRVFAFDVR